MEQGVDCSDQGMCMDNGDTYGCVCFPNYHPSDDGLDCVADGAEGR